MSQVYFNKPIVKAVGCSIALLILTSCEKSKELTIEEGLREINGTQLYTKVMGEGEPIVILHGGPGMDHTYFLPQMAELAETHKLIFFDQRVSGRSSLDVDSSAITMRHFIDDIEEIRKTFNLGKMNLMGHSWGGLLAMFYGITYPENLKSLMILNSTPASSELMAKTLPRLTPEDSLQRLEILNSDAFKNRESAAFEKLLRIHFRGAFYDRSLADSLTLTFQPDFAETSVKLQNLYKDIASYDIHHDLSKINCPTLVVHGDHDDNPLEGSQKIHENIPNSKFVLLKNCGHFPFVERPKEFFSAIKDFLQKKI
ncbi:alpha/beta fold hydrolase [candidate division KSB1 bacterium]|nr:alpha/beta fold hydrolase [candidate division KSB1 bacterium]